MEFKAVNQINRIGAIKSFTKPNCDLCMEERLTVLKKIHDRNVTLLNNNLEIYEFWQHKTTFRLFFLIIDDPING